MENIDFNPSPDDWKEQKKTAAETPGQFNQEGSELPPDEGEEMEILTESEAQQEFDPTKQGEASGDYSGERVTGRQEFGDQVAEDITQWGELDQQFLDKIQNPEGANMQEKTAFLKKLYASLTRQSFEKRNVDVKFRELAREALKSLGIEGITTIPAYIHWLKGKAEKHEITQAQMAERRQAAHEDIVYLQNFYEKTQNADLYQRAGEVIERIQKNSI